MVLDPGALVDLQVMVVLVDLVCLDMSVDLEQLSTLLREQAPDALVDLEYWGIHADLGTRSNHALSKGCYSHVDLEAMQMGHAHNQQKDL